MTPEPTTTTPEPTTTTPEPTTTTPETTTPEPTTTTPEPTTTTPEPTTTTPEPTTTTPEPTTTTTTPEATTTTTIPEQTTTTTTPEPTTTTPEATTTEDPLPCLNLPCTNGRCIFKNNGWTCDCNPGFQLLDDMQHNCVDFDECKNSKHNCHHFCTNIFGTYECSCRSGYSLDPQDKNTCRDNNECNTKSLCNNGGKCSNTLGSYECKCASGWKGKHCDEDVNECKSSPCENNGNCKNTDGSFECTCIEGYTGKRCGQVIDNCASISCGTNGSCVNQLRSHYCDCDEGWSGENCNQNRDDCVGINCQHGSTCVDLINIFDCNCASGYSGTYCQINIDDCLSNPCDNGGTCLDGINQFRCICAPGWTGSLCKQDVNECDATPCDADRATCHNTDGSFTCTCKEGYRGNGVNCKEIRLFPYGDKLGDQLAIPHGHQDCISQTFHPPYGIPFGDRMYYKLYFTDNGAIIFLDKWDHKFYFPNPPPNGFGRRNSPPTVAVFWDDVDLSGGVGKIYYQEYDFTGRTNQGQNSKDYVDLKTKVEQQINQNFTMSFDMEWMLKITWEDVPAMPAISNLDNTNTFQAILTTDGIHTFCLNQYEDGMMLWRTESRHRYANRALIGFDSGISDPNRLIYNDKIMTQSNRLRYRPDEYYGKIVVGRDVKDMNARGLWAFRLETHSKTFTNPRKECWNWYKKESFPFYHWYDRPCPCSWFQGIFDPGYTSGRRLHYYNFEEPHIPGTAVTLQSRWPSWFGSGVRCHYNRWGMLLHGRHEKVLPTPWNQPVIWNWNWRWGWHWIFHLQASWLTEQRNTYHESELHPFKHCCDESESFEFCQYYHIKRPIDFCFGYRPPFLGGLSGDPHMSTLDGIEYTFNGLGDFVILYGNNTNGSSLMVQGSTQQAGEQQNLPATNFIVIVAKENDGPTVEWKLSGEENVNISLNGKPMYLDLSGKNVTFNQTELSRPEPNTVSAEFPSGASINVSAVLGALQLTVSLPIEFQNQTCGLLGLFNNYGQDDFIARNGTVIPFSGDDPPDEKTLFFDFGMTWEVKPEESIFTEPSENKHKSGYEPVFLEDLLKSKSEDEIAKAKAECGDDESCLFDILTTNNTAFGKATHEAKVKLVSTKVVLRTFPPNVTGDSTLYSIMNEEVKVQYQTDDDDGANVIFTLVTNSSDINITENGVLMWRPTSIEPTFAIVVANNSKAVGQLVLTLVVCSCENNGTCDFEQEYSSTSGEGGTIFKVATCNCSQGYTANDCSEDFNPCTNSTCFAGVTCTDKPAPSLDFECGPCPDRLIGNGSKCYDIDECLNNSPCEHNCINILPGYNCTCHEGYSINSSDSNKCDDIDECANESSCVDNAQCNNLPGTYNCTCDVGFSGDGSVVCEDIDECRNESACGDHSICTNNNGSFSCSCEKGYRGTPCTDWNECTTNTECHLNADCVNTIGSYKCTCKSGYTGDGRDCVDIDECLSGHNTSCDAETMLCKNLKGSYTCDCRPGYRNDSGQCIDIDECAQESYRCMLKEMCKNTKGSFQCVCKPGYERVGGSCMDIDECKGTNSCDQTTNCINNNGSYSCTCKPGFTRLMNNSCSDVDECLLNKLNNCSRELGICNNVDGGFDCQCERGSHGDGVTCTADDMCKTSPCKGNASCENTYGGYTCSCPPSYELTEDKRGCQDLDECQVGSYCPQNCSNTVGGFTCSCFEGFKEEGDTCIPKDNCTNSSCGDHSFCLVNASGGDECLCKQGYEQNGSQCTNKNECDMKPCDKNLGDCTDTDGSFKCSCQKGFTLSTDGLSCEDINECQSGNLQCDANANCSNIYGSYTCKCQNGYTGNGTSCEDVDECFAALEAMCAADKTCNNTVGGYECLCASGYRTDENGTCIDIDECNAVNKVCQPHSRCINTLGSHKCVCNEGYNSESESGTCVDINECLNLEYCSEDANCENRNGSFSCDCKPGFNGKGSICDDVDECTLHKDNCHSNANCSNTIGSFKCTCKDGFIGNGINCTAPPATTATPSSLVSTTATGISATAVSATTTTTLSPAIPTISLVNSPGKGHLKNVNLKLKSTNRLYFEDMKNPTSEKYKSFVKHFTVQMAPIFQAIHPLFHKVVVHSLTNGSVDVDCTVQYSYAPNDTVRLFYENDLVDAILTVVNKKNPNETEILFHPLTRNNINAIATLTQDEVLELYDCNTTELGYKTVWVDEIIKCVYICNTSKPIPCSGLGNCVPQPDGAYCNCTSGYTAMDLTCKDVNECEANTHNCHENATCENTNGSFTCPCKQGYRGESESGTCVDINECVILEYCSEDANCENRNGSFSCDCKPGFNGNGSICDDVDECTLHKDNCHSNANCSNTIGSFKCTCKDGFIGNGINCTAPPATTATPSSLVSTTLQMTTTATGISATAVSATTTTTLSPAIPTISLVNSTGKGHLKNVNLKLKSTNRLYFEDMKNPTSEKYKSFVKHFTVQMTPIFQAIYPLFHKVVVHSLTNGSVDVDCTVQYSYAPNDTVRLFYENDLVDAILTVVNKKNPNEAEILFHPLTRNNISAIATLTQDEVLELYDCNTTELGYKTVWVDEIIKCVYICNTSKPIPCSGLGNCVPQLDGAYCNCTSGYTAMDLTCKDVNECEANTHNCHENATCENTNGSFTCPCKQGYRGESESGTCVDINECVILEYCSEDANCENRNGSFSCDCKPGFNGNGSICDDVDECTLHKDNCHSNANCSNTIGSFKCTCKDGFIGNGINCTAPPATTATPSSLVSTTVTGISSTAVSATTTTTLSPAIPTISLVNSPGKGHLKNVNLKLKSTNRLYFEDMKNPTSEKYKSFVKHFTVQMAPIFQAIYPLFHKVVVHSLTKGSVDVNCTVQYSYAPNDTVRLFYENDLVDAILTVVNKKNPNDTEILFHPLTRNNINAIATLTQDEVLELYECNTNELGYKTVWVDEIIKCVYICNTSKPIPCSGLGNCVPQLDGAYCNCTSGYTAMDLTCKDVNECEANTHNCHENATCENTNGSFTCPCKQGYRGNGTFCECHPDECNVNPCINDGTCVGSPNKITDKCELVCRCPPQYKGERCEEGANYVNVILRQGAARPKVGFEMRVIFKNEIRMDPTTVEMLKKKLQEIFGNVPTYGPDFFETSDPIFSLDNNGKVQASFTAFYNYTNQNIDEIYNGAMREAIRRSFPHLSSRSYRGLVILNDSVIIQKNAAVDQLNNFFECNTSYKGYEILTNDTAIYCISPCESSKNYCNDGNCSHTPSGPTCTCATSSGIHQSTGDRCQNSTILTNTFYKILFGTLAGILGLALLIGLIAFCIRRRSHSDSANLLNDNNSIASDTFNKQGKFSKSVGFPWISNVPETKRGANMLSKLSPVS
uniref:fibrillin-1-like n=1 Tax=Myxine glutinosa TaxID=7769 RepID=UPI00359018BB